MKTLALFAVTLTIALSMGMLAEAQKFMTGPIRAP